MKNATLDSRDASGNTHIVQASSMMPHPSGKMMSSMMMNIATYATSAPPRIRPQPDNTHLHYQELLPDRVSDRPTSSPRVSYREHVQVERQNNTNDPVAQYYRKRAFSASMAQSQADPRLLKVVGEESDFSTDVGETRFEELCDG